MGLRPRQAWEDWTWDTGLGRVVFATPLGNIEYSFVLARRPDGWYIARWGLVPLNGGSYPTQPERQGPFASAEAARASAEAWIAETRGTTTSES
jgi:hypothetical protein